MLQQPSVTGKHSTTFNRPCSSEAMLFGKHSQKTRLCEIKSNLLFKGDYLNYYLKVKG